jgi:hypothetical protein
LHVDFYFSAEKAPPVSGFEIIQTCVEGFMERALLCYFWDNVRGDRNRYDIIHGV